MTTKLRARAASHRDAGVTLVEVLVAVGVIALVVAVAAPNLGAGRDRRAFELGSARLIAAAAVARGEAVRDGVARALVRDADDAALVRTLALRPGALAEMLNGEGGGPGGAPGETDDRDAPLAVSTAALASPAEVLRASRWAALGPSAGIDIAGVEPEGFAPPPMPDAGADAPGDGGGADDRRAMVLAVMLPHGGAAAGEPAVLTSGPGYVGRVAVRRVIGAVAIEEIETDGGPEGPGFAGERWDDER